uniref:Pentacotripeptide-repeat region of PRORP domain-containing protein n=2 Tax=Nymphaea colorata TaxID=210225 RepID=A0A5K1GG33_9MAGN
MRVKLIPFLGNSSKRLFFVAKSGQYRVFSIRGLGFASLLRLEDEPVVATDEPPSRRSISVVAKSAKLDFAKRAFFILRKCGWDFGLSNGIPFTFDESNVPNLLNDVFDSSSDAQLTFDFFRWLERQKESPHGIRSVCTMIHLLVSANMNHAAVSLVSGLIRSYRDHFDCSHVMFDAIDRTRRDKRPYATVYSMFISCFLEVRMINEALDFISRMLLLGLSPSSKACNSVISLLLGLKQFARAWELLAQFGCSNTILVSLFVNSFCDEGDILLASKLLFSMRDYGSKPDVVTYTMLLNALSKRGNVREANALLYKMTETGVTPDIVSVSVVIDGYSKLGRWDKALNVLRKSGFRPDIFVYNSFISTLCRVGCVVEATELFDEMCHVGLSPDCHSYTAIISGYCNIANMSRARKYLCEMLKKGFNQGIVTFTVLIRGYCKARDLEEAEYLLRLMLVDRIQPDIFIYNALIDGHSKNGNMHKAFEWLDCMKKMGVSPDITTYNIIIHGLVRKGFLRESHQIVDELVRRGFCPDQFTYTNIIDGYSRGGNFREAFLIWCYMSEKGIQPDVVTCSALLNGLCKAHRMEEASALFQRLLYAGLKPDRIVYNDLIHGYCNEGNIPEISRLINMMLRERIYPDAMTYRSLVKAFEKNRAEHALEHAATAIKKLLSKNGVCI